MSSRRSICRWCGLEDRHGSSCSSSLYGVHMEIGDGDHCIYCGSSSYGSSCIHNPGIITAGKTVHVHGHDDSSNPRCVYCGDRRTGPGCLFSPNGMHQL